MNKPRNEETTRHNEVTTKHNEVTTRHNEVTTRHNEETTPHNEETTHVMINRHMRKLWPCILPCEQSLLRSS